MIFVLFFYIHFFLLCIFVSSSNQLAHIMEIYINVILITFTATHTIFITMITIMRITSPQAVRSKNTFLKANAPVGLIRPKIVNPVQNNKKMTSNNQQSSSSSLLAIRAAAPAHHLVCIQTPLTKSVQGPVAKSAAPKTIATNSRCHQNHFHCHCHFHCHFKCLVHFHWFCLFHSAIAIAT